MPFPRHPAGPARQFSARDERNQTVSAGAGYHLAMDLKQLITRLAYKIEPKPEGGFIARATDPTVPPLEAPTREELQQKIRESMSSALSSEFPGMKFPTHKHVGMSFHIEHKPGGGFSIHSADPNTPVMEVADLKQFEAEFLNKVGLAANNPLIQTLAKGFFEQAGDGNMDVFIDKNTTFRTKTTTAFSAPSSSAAPSLAGMLGNTPITPESTNLWKIVSVILLAIVATLVYFLLLHR